MPAVAVVLGGFWPENGVSSLTLSGEDSYGQHQVARALGTKGQASNRALLDALLGVAPGATATATRTRIAHSEELGGVRAIETETLINRATTAGDVTTLEANLLTFSTRTYDPTPVANLDGNPLGTR